MSGIVAIVGRPNVGKSTLFNRLVGERQAIIHESSGVTRDRHYGKSDWNGIEFSVIDTGGYVSASGDLFEEEIKKQVVLAIEESDAIIFLVDVTTGTADMDLEVANLLRKSNKKVFLTANKVDNTERSFEIHEFYKLGLGEVYGISSINGSGTGELLDALIKILPERPKSEDEENIPKYAIIGRPNVGKSSLVNALLGEDRNIVTPISGTTRDSIYSRYKKFGQDFILIDTAGLRKKEKVTEQIEFYSILRSIRTIENSDVCLLLIDATRGIEAQDMNIFQLVQKNNKGLVILVNKWDLVEKDTKSTEIFTKAIHERIAPWVDVPVIFISALSKQRVHKALEIANEVYNNRARKISTSKLNDVMLKEIENFHPPVYKGKQVKIKYLTQLPTRYPAFVFFCNLPQYVKEPYKRFLENKLRSHFIFTGVPVTIFMRKK